MKATLFWMQSGGCGGDTMSLLNMESPDLREFLDMAGVEVLWHPSLSTLPPGEQEKLLQAILAGDKRVDVFCMEGSLIRGPGGTGMYDTHAGQPRKDLVAALAARARFVVAVGTCASFGGIGADGEVEATGLQFHKEAKGGFLGGDFVSAGGLPVVNLPGCPAHCGVISDTIASLLGGDPIPLNPLNAPDRWYGMLIHQGCMRNEYHEYRVEETDFGQKGCLFFHMGCRGPLTHGPCNKLRWNRRNSKTSAGVPCVGCTQPSFPSPYPFFHTRNIAGIPIDLPEGVSRAHYLAYKGMAAAAAPERLVLRKTRV